MLQTIHQQGNSELLKNKKLLFMCSKHAPTTTYDKVFSWIDSLTKEDCVVCCNTTELEVEVIKSLLVKEVPTILIAMNRYDNSDNIQVWKALEEQRLLILVMEQTGTDRWLPKDRNEYLINNMADSIVCGYIDKRGSIFPLLIGNNNVVILNEEKPIADAIPNKGYQRWTPSEDKALLRMYYADYSIYEIKEQLKRSFFDVKERIFAIALSDDYLKGREFEEFVLELLDIKGTQHLLKEWRGDKSMGDICPENNHYPDLLIEEVETKRCVAIECKWRQHINNTAMSDLFAPINLISYHDFSNERNIPVVIILGVGGLPCNPEKVYIIPLEKADFKQTSTKDDSTITIYETSQLASFKRTIPDAPLYFDELLAQCSNQQTESSKVNKPGYFDIVRKDHPNAYRSWTPTDEKSLIQLFKEGKTIEALSLLLGRQPGGIRSRLAKLGLIKKE